MKYITKILLYYYILYISNIFIILEIYINFIEDILEIVSRNI